MTFRLGVIYVKEDTDSNDYTTYIDYMDRCARMVAKPNHSLTHSSRFTNTD